MTNLLVDRTHRSSVSCARPPSASDRIRGQENYGSDRSASSPRKTTPMDSGGRGRVRFGARKPAKTRVCAVRAAREGFEPSSAHWRLERVHSFVPAASESRVRAREHCAVYAAKYAVPAGRADRTVRSRITREQRGGQAS